MTSFRQELQRKEPASCCGFMFYSSFLLFLHTLVGVKAVEDGWMLLFDSKFQTTKSHFVPQKSGF